MMFSLVQNAARVTAICLVSLPAFAQTRVACVGDSITEGYGLTTPQTDAYPAQLQVALGTDYDVENFGVSGTTLLKAGDRPYWNEPAFTQSTAFAPQVVLLMLGTNDAKPRNWNEAAFRADYAELLAHYRELGAEVFIATPAKVFGDGAFDIPATTVNDIIVPLVRELAADYDAPLADVFAATASHPEWFPDNIHPSKEGAKLLADTFAAAILESGAATSEPPNGVPTDSATSSDAASLGSTTSTPSESEVTSVPSATAASMPSVTSSASEVTLGSMSTPASSSGPSAGSSFGSSTSVPPNVTTSAPPSVSSVGPLPSGEPTAIGTTATGTTATSGSGPAPESHSACSVVHSSRRGGWAGLCALILVALASTRRRGLTRACEPT